MGKQSKHEEWFRHRAFRALCYADWFGFAFAWWSLYISLRREGKEMSEKIRKKIVVDENNEPLEVIIDYADWRKIEKILLGPEEGATAKDLSRYAGALKLREDPLDYQKRIRNEWR